MQINKKIIVLAVFVIATIVSVAAIQPPEPKSNFKNLKVLPKDISGEALDHIMDQFKEALGVKCGFCHAKSQDSLHLDFASDAKPEKDIARSMMRMTMAINKKYFEVKHPMIGDSTLAVSCITCHHGSPHPGE